MILIKEIQEKYNDYKDQRIVISGWIKNSRFTKNVGFIELNDGTSFKPVQIVIENDNPKFNEIEKLPLSSAIIVEGFLNITPQAKQAFEIKADTVIIEGVADLSYPLQKKRHTFEFLRTIPQLRARTNTFHAVFKVRSELAYAIHKFFHDRNFVYVHTPIITSADAEGAGERFQITTLDLQNLPKTEKGNADYTKDFFGKKSYLTVSGQLHVETFAMAFRNVYTFGPTFRSENSNTTRHVAEFWQIEPEMAFTDLEGVCNTAEAMVKYIISHVLKTCSDEIEFFNQFVDKGLKQRLELVANSEFRRMEYTEAIDILQNSGENFDYPVSWGSDIQTEHERYLCEKIVGGPVFLINYPKDIKAFYMRINDDKKTVAATDLLVPGIGELIGGSQREERMDVMLERIEEMGLKADEYQWYLDVDRYGSTKHGGFGLGFERMVMYCTGMTNIRDVLPFPRTVGHCDF